MTGQAVPSLLAALLERLEVGRDGRESSALEFKRAGGGLPKSLWETVSAFANTSGGWLVLGVNEETQPIAIEGVSDASAMLQRFWDQMRNRQKISAEVCAVDDAAIERLGDRDIVVIRVPAASRKVRPVHIDGNPYAGTFVRRHAGDHRCTKAEVDRMMREASEVAADATIIPHFGWDDLDRDTFARYRRQFQTIRPEHIWNGYSDDQFLRSVNGWRTDRSTGAEGLTVAGLLMFGRPESIREWRTRHLIDFRLLSGGLGTASDWEDRLVWEGNLLGAFTAIYPRLTVGLPTPFRLDGPTRVEETPVHAALREALVNLLVHADYAETAPSLILKSSDGFLFRNPGASRVPEGELTLGRHSDLRNPELVLMFRLINLAEEAGSGIQRIFHTWRDLGYRTPTIDSGTERYEFALHLRHLHLFSDDDRAWLGSLGPITDEAEQLALLIARHDGDVDNLRLRSLSGQHPADATKTLGGLRNRGLLSMSGWGRGASYELGSPIAMGGEPAALRRGDGPAQPVAPHVPSHLGGEATDGLGDSETSIGDKGSSFGDSTTDLGQAASSADRRTDDEQALAHMARQHARLTPTQRETIIGGLCDISPRSVTELAAIMGRHPDHLRSIVRGLVAAGRLAPLFPDRPQSPRQRYRHIAPEESR